MPLLPVDNGWVIDAGELVVRDDSDVLALLPVEYRRGEETEEIRDALVAAVTKTHQKFHDRAAYAAAQCDISRATGVHLEGQAADRDFHKATGETEAQFRARILANPELVTTKAIMDRVNALLAPHTPAEAHGFEGILDQWFVGEDGVDNEWESFVGAAPNYPSRFYPDLSEPAAIPRSNSSPGDARVFAGEMGRLFVIRVPDLVGIDAQRAYAASDDGEIGFFLTDAGGNDELNGSFVARETATAETVYGALVGSVAAIKGHSIRWIVLIDESLT